MTKNFSEARKTLLKACEGYIRHNQYEFAHLKAESSYWPALDFFYGVLREEEPDFGFNDWVCCQYFYLLESILNSFKKQKGGSPYLYFKDKYKYPFEEMKWWNGHYNVELDQTAPKVVLHNLNALLNVLNFHMERKIPELAQKMIELNYHENDLTVLSDASLSIRIHKTLENLKLRANFAKSITQFSGLDTVCRTLEQAIPVFEGYIKGVAVRELKITLKNSALGDKEAIKRVERQLKNDSTIELLQKNRQSKNEKELKLLSIISIFIGIGIFTTLGLACKRFYDSGGTSINFFKPLSQNLYEDINQELQEAAKSADWNVHGETEPSSEDIQKAYEQVGRNEDIEIPRI